MVSLRTLESVKDARLIIVVVDSVDKGSQPAGLHGVRCSEAARFGVENCPCSVEVDVQRSKSNTDSSKTSGCCEIGTASTCSVATVHEKVRKSAS